jgi:hypothetical protein
MSDAYVIEIAGRTAGIVAREHGREAFTFFASDAAFYSLEGKKFTVPSAATRAARKLIEAPVKVVSKPTMIAGPRELTL